MNMDEPLMITDEIRAGIEKEKEEQEINKTS